MLTSCFTWTRVNHLLDIEYMNRYLADSEWNETGTLEQEQGHPTSSCGDLQPTRLTGFLYAKTMRYN